MHISADLSQEFEEGFDAVSVVRLTPIRLICNLLCIVPAMTGAVRRTLLFCAHSIHAKNKIVTPPLLYSHPPRLC